MTYDPREYWPRRMKRSGKAYVAHGNSSTAFDRQNQAFWDVLANHLPGDGRVLDFGCGVGRFAATLSENFQQYDGVDLNEGALEYAPDIENATFTYLVEDVLPFEDDTFDAAVSLTVIQHIVDPAAFDNWMQELARVVKTGGYFFVIDDPRLNKAGVRIKDATHMCRRTPEIIAFALKSIIQAQGKLSAETEDSHYYFLSEKI